ncbi:MAG TPA: ATP-binding protein [Solirubrobacteraceae bacterium]|nr:ATP-binding protein [Solirubrobacteraceae bacterium]
MEPEELAEALKRLSEWAARHAPVPESPVHRRLRAHLEADPSELPVVTRPLEAWDRPNVQVAIDAWLADREAEVVGPAVMEGYRAGLAELVRAGEWAAAVQLGGVEHVTVPLGEDESITCVQSGLWLVRDGEQRLVVMLNSVDFGPGERLSLEVMALERGRAEAVLRELGALMAERNVYRGRVLELRARHFHADEGAPLTVRTLPDVPRDGIVLPDGVLERVERQAFGIARHAARLRASGRHLRRGLLLHGPPGTGKTLTVMYLAGAMPERTVVLLTGSSLGMVGTSVDLATALQPAIVVLEDADLVAMERSFEPTNAILFELLNAMDGLDEDHDVLFVLTTNRADRLEPALAARPGRVDQAVELPLPDATARRRLLELYGRGLSLRLDDEQAVIAELDGTSPAFIRELLRRAALLAAEDGDGPLRVGERHVRGALAELRRGGEELTRTLLGARPPSVPWEAADALELDEGDHEEDDDEDGGGVTGRA